MQTSFTGASFTAPFSFDYNIWAIHNDYPTIEKIIDVLYKDIEYFIIMDGSGVETTEINNNFIIISPNPSSNGIFKLIKPHGAQIINYIITDIYGKK